jgi:hypothetical protein
MKRSVSRLSKKRRVSKTYRASQQTPTVRTPPVTLPLPKDASINLSDPLPRFPLPLPGQPPLLPEDDVDMEKLIPMNLFDDPQPPRPIQPPRPKQPPPDRRPRISPSNKNPARYKTVLCNKFCVNGKCPYGLKCQFAHGEDELLT